ncbi:ATP-binding protein [Zavarzinia compransoris]|uniref:histidine kinase n=1 Tax=Zavarzinia compransoris TaxID=1264899 RepID=A0A317DTY7_9PROT|nr:ATP-binding protein [Zavarzinia compransoris]PWR17842.1 histidine kinase [Zavarzinia compransoris]TDP49377.1 two-component system sensor histidine kinase RegB [Zavarzinia compransoris]
MEDFTNKKNLLILIQLRWLAVCGQVITMEVVHYMLGITLPLPSMAAVVLFLIALNIVALTRYRQLEEVTNFELMLELLLDVVALTIQLYLSGGASNPFISLYLLQVILAAVLLEAWSAWLVVAVSIGGFIALTFAHYPLNLPHGGPQDLFSLHVQGMFIGFFLAAFLVVLFLSRIQGNLRSREANLAALRQRALEEDHVVRLGLLASGAAHELGTPLATLSVILGDWQRMPALAGDPDLKREMAEMQAQLERCKAIVSGILLSAGDMRGEGTLRTTLAGFLDETVEEWRDSRNPAALDYTSVITDDVPIVSDTALKQVIFNVLDNALEASPAWIGVAAGRQGGNIVVTVSDAGPGFAPEMLKEFGKPYRSTKGRPGGGLGLYLVANVVRKLGGTVSARNGADGGASVTLALPVAALSPVPLPAGGAHER